MAVIEVMRMCWVALDPTHGQRAGASRAACNHHLAARIAAHQAWVQEVAWSTYTDHADLPPAGACSRVAIVRGDQAPLVTQDEGFRRRKSAALASPAA